MIDPCDTNSITVVAAALRRRALLFDVEFVKSLSKEATAWV